MTLEICIDTIESAKNAIKGGATRLEICSALSEGGLTPTPGFVRRIREISKIPIYAMIRVRGGDFVYSEKEMDAMLEDLEFLKTLNVDGFVFGALTENRFIDESNCKKILASASPLPVTFHRAFDDGSFDDPSDLSEAIETLIRLGFKRILSSGRKKTAEDGLDLLSEMCKIANKRISIMPGSGITPENLMKIKRKTGAEEFHASARVTKSQDFEMDFMFKNHLVTDSDQVRQMINMLNEDVSGTRID